MAQQELFFNRNKLSYTAYFCRNLFGGNLRIANRVYGFVERAYREQARYFIIFSNLRIFGFPMESLALRAYPVWMLWLEIKNFEGSFLQHCCDSGINNVYL